MGFIERRAKRLMERKMTSAVVSLLRLLVGVLAGMGIVVSDDWVIQTANIVVAVGFWAITKLDILGKLKKWLS